ncbi:hypothetical protein LTR84_001653 [Exophiala bonariae]|uniref:NmrA-like domain-containing protein n=1 Tax=Exophiala bonariae TaxID=1690606 RepID=A0AAV9NFM9_9EURO|nr:hypothetical protein LTR84_001653 [Exophiala bonariae]
MSSLHIALVGATGNLGPAILHQLAVASFKITVLTRVGGSSKVEVPPGADILVKEVDYDDHGALVAALQTVEVAVSTLGFQSLFETQKKIIDACIEARVTRFLPSEFGNDTANENVRKLPVFLEKVKTQEYLVSKVANHPELSYTFLYTNSFFDWQLKIGFMVNLKDHTATLYDGGDVLFSATRLSTIGRAIVAVCKSLEATRNQDIYVHDASVTQKKLIDIARGIDDHQWQTNTVSTVDVERDAYSLLESGVQGDMVKASLGFISRACWGSGYGGDFTKKIHNEMLGIPLMSDDEIRDMIEEIISSSS